MSKLIGVLIVAGAMAVPVSAMAAKGGTPGPNPNQGQCVSAAQKDINAARKAGEEDLSELEAAKAACKSDEANPS